MSPCRTCGCKCLARKEIRAAARESARRGVAGEHQPAVVAFAQPMLSGVWLTSSRKPSGQPGQSGGGGTTAPRARWHQPLARIPGQCQRLLMTCIPACPVSRGPRQSPATSRGCPEWRTRPRSTSRGQDRLDPVEVLLVIDDVAAEHKQIRRRLGQAALNDEVKYIRGRACRRSASR